MTIRDISLAIRQSGVRNHNEFALQGQLHGFKIPFKESFQSPKKAVHFTDQEDEAADELMEQIVRRKKQEGWS